MVCKTVPFGAIIEYFGVLCERALILPIFWINMIIKEKRVPFEKRVHWEKSGAKTVPPLEPFPGAIFFPNMIIKAKSGSTPQSDTVFAPLFFSVYRL